MIWPNVLGTNVGHIVSLTRRSYINQSPRPFKILPAFPACRDPPRRLCSDAATQEIQTIGTLPIAFQTYVMYYQKDYMKSCVSTIERNGVMKNLPETKFMAIHLGAHE